MLTCSNTTTLALVSTHQDDLAARIRARVRQRRNALPVKEALLSDLLSTFPHLVARPPAPLRHSPSGTVCNRLPDAGPAEMLPPRRDAVVLSCADANQPAGFPDTLCGRHCDHVEEFRTFRLWPRERPERHASSDEHTRGVLDPGEVRAQPGGQSGKDRVRTTRTLRDATPRPQQDRLTGLTIPGIRASEKCPDAVEDPFQSKSEPGIQILRFDAG